jgi:alpha-1,2-mannosyltransferase
VAANQEGVERELRSLESVEATNHPGPGSGGTNRVPVRVTTWLTSRRGRVLGWVSVDLALGYALACAFRHQVDFDVYRMGGAHLLGSAGSGLYQVRLPQVRLPFTYPPFAALVFFPFSHLSTRAGQLVWGVLSVAALAGLIMVCLGAAAGAWVERDPGPGERVGRVEPVRFVMGWRQIRSVALVALVPVVLLNPVFTTINLGQVNIFIVLLVLADLTRTLAWRGKTLPRGVLIGLAAAVKLTPLIFIPFLFLTRQFRAGLTALGTFVGLSLAALAVSPHASRLYWTKEVFDSRRAGNLLYVSDQNLRSAVQRMMHLVPPQSLLLVLTVVLGAAGLILATWAWRASSALLGVALCATTGLIVSPVSWSHHYVWVVPVLAWLTLGADRPRGGRWWALGVAILFWAAPIWWVPNVQRGYGGPVELLAANAFFLAAVAFLALSALLLWGRDRAGSGRTVRAPAGRGERTGAGPLVGIRSGLAEQ